MIKQKTPHVIRFDLTLGVQQKGKMRMGCRHWELCEQLERRMAAMSRTTFVQKAGPCCLRRMEQN
jgi:hypothetical protein